MLALIILIIILYSLIGVIVFSDLKENLLSGDVVNLIYYILLSIFWPLTLIIFILIIIITLIIAICMAFFKKKNKYGN